MNISSSEIAWWDCPARGTCTSIVPFISQGLRCPCQCFTVTKFPFIFISFISIIFKSSPTFLLSVLLSYFSSLISIFVLGCYRCRHTSCDSCGFPPDFVLNTASLLLSVPIVKPWLCVACYRVMVAVVFCSHSEYPPIMWASSLTFFSRAVLSIQNFAILRPQVQWAVFPVLVETENDLHFQKERTM